MHGSVCLFSKYLNHLLEGENLEELDISSAGSSDNIFYNQKTLSSGWTGTCPLINQYDIIYSNYTSELNSLINIFSSEHSNLLTSYRSTLNLINSLYTANYISATRPSGATTTLMPKCEYEFSDRTNLSLAGGEIYFDFVNKLMTNIENLNGTIRNNIINFEANDEIKNSVNSVYENLVNFDTTVATAANVMNNRIIDLKDYFLSIQFNLMFFTWGYMLFFGAIIFCYIFYLCNESSILWYFIVIFVHILLIMILVEIFLSAFFGQVRLICHEVPRAMNFIFTGSYIVSGNSASYPAKFGTGNANMTKMFTTCLNGDGDLVKSFLTSSDISALSTLRNSVTNLYLNVKKIVDNSNIITNDINNIDNSILLESIIYLQEMKKNLYMATEGFGDDDIYNILRNIRLYLDAENCTKTNEYYVVREADCPSGSTKLTTIYDITGINHCYIIPNLPSSAQASYANSGCQRANNYINLAIPFIKEIYNNVEMRLLMIQSLQYSYANSFNALWNEITTISNKINSTFNLLNSNLNSSKISNCSSVRFDLIDFSDFIGDTTEYDAQIVVIFSAFIGVFGYVMLYSFLVVLNSFSDKEYDNDYDDYDYGSGKNKNRIRNINNNVYKAKPIKRETVSDEEEEEEDEDFKKKINKKKIVKKENVPIKTGQKVEMSYLPKNDEDSDSS